MQTNFLASWDFYPNYNLYVFQSKHVFLMFRFHSNRIAEWEKMVRCLFFVLVLLHGVVGQKSKQKWPTLSGRLSFFSLSNHYIVCLFLFFFFVFEHHISFIWTLA